MVALALQIRILFILVALGLAAYVLWRVWQRVRQRLAADPRLRQAVPALVAQLLRRGLIPLLLIVWRLLRGLR